MKYLNPYIILSCIPFILLVFGCSKRSGSGFSSKSTIVVDLEDVDSHKVNFSSVYDSVEYVPLELPDNLYIGSVNKVVHHAGKIYIFDFQKAKRLFVFKEDGRYLHSIFQSGAGPTEYQAPLDFIVWDGKIEILDINNKVIIFDEQGEFFEQFKLPFNTDKLVKITNSKYILYLKDISDTRFGENAKCDLMFYDRDTKESSCILETGSTEGMLFFNERNVFSRDDKKILFSKVFMDSVFSINNSGEVTLEYVLNFGSDSYPKDLIDTRKHSMVEIIEGFNSSIDKAFHYPNLFSNSEYIISSYDKEDINSVFLERESNSYKVLKRGAKNDIDGGVPFYGANCVTEDEVLSIIDPNVFLDLYYSYQYDSSINVSHDFLEFTKQLNTNSPPIIVKYKLN